MNPLTPTNNNTNIAISDKDTKLQTYGVTFKGYPVFISPCSFGPVRYSYSALSGNGSTFQMLIEEVDGSGPGLFSRLFVVSIWVGEVHERVIRAFVCEELMDFAQAR